MTAAKIIFKSTQFKSVNTRGAHTRARVKAYDARPRRSVTSILHAGRRVVGCRRLGEHLQYLRRHCRHRQRYDTTAINATIAVTAAAAAFANATPETPRTPTADQLSLVPTK